MPEKPGLQGLMVADDQVACLYFQVPMRVMNRSVRERGTENAEPCLFQLQLASNHMRVRFATEVNLDMLQAIAPRMVRIQIDFSY